MKNSPEISKKDIKSYVIRSAAGFEVRILNFGCIITDIRVPDKEGIFENVVLRLGADEAYTDVHPYVGATVGRYSNRIANGSYSHDDMKIQLSVNEFPNQLHGGFEGFDKKLWKCLQHHDRYVEFGYTSDDGEEGYPGNLRVIAGFSISGDKELTIRYHAVTDKTTPVSITNHSYFNLTGDPSKTISGHRLQILADQYTPSDSFGIPDGQIAEVAGTIFDFRSMKALALSEGYAEKGFDHNYVLRKGKSKKNLQRAACLHEPETGRTLDVLTEKPGMQLYTGGGLDGSLVDDKARQLQKFSGLCLETQFYPDSPNNRHFPSPFLSPGEIYDYKTIFRFFNR